MKLLKITGNKIESRTDHSSESFLGIYLQCDRHPHCCRAAVSHHRIPAQSHDRGSCHGAQFCECGDQQSAVEG